MDHLETLNRRLQVRERARERERERGGERERERERAGGEMFAGEGGSGERDGVMAKGETTGSIDKRKDRERGVGGKYRDGYPLSKKYAYEI
jgi:hypothetical protein